MRYDAPVKGDLVGVIERLVVGSVAITARAIAAADAELTFMQWRVLLIVGERDEGQAVGEIAARIGAHASPASRVVSRLKRRGLVSADKGELDKRVVCVRLTEAGRDLRARVLSLRGRDLADVLDVVSMTPEESEALARLAQAFEPFA
jgi:DNA-binding MarR family transcriptional regulator